MRVASNMPPDAITILGRATTSLGRKPEVDALRLYATITQRHHQLSHHQLTLVARVPRYPPI